ncbi:MAG: aminopeptidase P family protein [Trueperaceae bacterium]|nr:aminopeptidase P family protein [Trueperaceae bacterium]
MIDLVREKLAKTGADALLITQPANVRYLSGFGTPEDGRVFVTEDQALLITDGRYIAQAKEQSSLEQDIVAMGSQWPARVLELAKGKTLAVEADHLTHAQFDLFAKDLKLVPVESFLTEFRLIKQPHEIQLISEAAKLTDEAFSHILNVIKVGMKEVEVALELERFMRTGGADSVAFPITVASGYRSSMPHGTASGKVIEAGDLVTLDFGAKIQGYHSDMTRTLAMGTISEDEEKMYAAVLEAQETALAAIGPEKDGREIDRIARDILGEHDLDQYFSHSLGHGVGMMIHEEPWLRSNMSYILKAGMTATIEPGAYIPGKYGVRIEDLLVITSTTKHVLSSSDKSLIRL